MHEWRQKARGQKGETYGVQHDVVVRDEQVRHLSAIDLAYIGSSNAIGHMWLRIIAGDKELLRYIVPKSV